jgi:hypothetical protein
MVVIAKETLTYCPCDAVVITVYKGRQYDVIGNIDSGFWLISYDDSFRMKISYNELHNNYIQVEN